MMGLFPAGTDFGLTNAQTDAVQLVLQKTADKKLATMRREMREAQAANGERRILKFDSGNGGEVRMMVHPVSYHYWGQRLGYQCWEDKGFCREYLRDNPEARVKSRADALTLIVQGKGGLSDSGRKRFHKSYPSSLGSFDAASAASQAREYARPTNYEVAA